MNGSPLTQVSTEFSSFTELKPMVLQQSFIFPNPVRAIGVTQTVHGITHKQIVLGMASGQVAAIHKSFLDARRPPKHNVSNFDREEGLIPYDPTLPINTKLILNYYRRVKVT